MTWDIGAFEAGGSMPTPVPPIPIPLPIPPIPPTAPTTIELLVNGSVVKSGPIGKPLTYTLQNAKKANITVMTK